MLLSNMIAKRDAVVMDYVNQFGGEPEMFMMHALFHVQNERAASSKSLLNLVRVSRYPFCYK